MADKHLDPDQERALVDQFALVLERSGLPPVAGRIIGRLLLCDPPHQSSQELMAWVDASAGGVSQATRLLVHSGIVERVRFRGDRAMYFRIREGAWGVLLREEAQRAQTMRVLADQGLQLLAGAPSARRKRMKEFRDMYAFFEKEFPSLVERFEARKGER
jgi:hypothetical protein